MRGRATRLAMAIFAILSCGNVGAARGAPALPVGSEAPGQWPHVLHRPEADVTIYQPQAEAWQDRRLLTARAAVSIAPKQGPAILGTIEVSLSTQVDAATSTVRLSDPRLIASNFPSLDTSRAALLQGRLAAALPEMQTREVPLASVLLSLGQAPVTSVTLDNDPPHIFVSSRPASLIVFDGDPVLAPIGKTGLSVAVNTNWDVFRADGTWYLLDNGTWMAAPAATGPYTPTVKLPSAFRSLPPDANLADARKAIPAKLPAPNVTIPTIFVSTTPADIIVTDGPPKLVPVAGTPLQRVANTQGVLFLDPRDGSYYVLLAGRWFAAAQLAGPWRYATDGLPADFSAIPADGPEGAVLASVPGTQAAQEAVIKVAIPVTATLKRGTASISVAYSGAPRFEPIPGTTISAAVNTHSTVLRIGERYYVCDNGAWFVGPSPTGPWTLADSVPEAVKTIPPQSPYYNVTYAQVYGATPQTVTYGYTAGYVMGFVTAGVLVYGTGYYYPPVVIPGPVPIYYPRPYTYAGSIWYSPASGAWVRGGSVWGTNYGAAAVHGYNPATGAWGRGGAVYGPYGGAGAWSYYNPTTGAYARGTASWSNGSGVANASYYNPRTGVSGSTNQNWNPYSRWGSSTVSGPNRTVDTRSAGNANGVAGGFTSSTGAAVAGYHNRNTGASGGVVKTQNDNVYAGRDGNVYKNTGDGWQKWNNGGWNPVKPPTTTGAGTGRQTLSGSQNARSGTVDRSSWQQLQRDQTGRTFGQGQSGARRGGGGTQYRRGRYQR